MLMHLLPFWATVIALAAVLIAKYILIGRISKLAIVSQLVAGKGWMATLLITAALNGVVTLGLMLFVVGFGWSLFAAILDFAFHFFAGYYKVKKTIPKVDAGNLVDAQDWLVKVGKWFAAFHSASYIGLATSVIELAQKHPEWVTKVLAWVHLA